MAIKILILQQLKMMVVDKILQYQSLYNMDLWFGPKTVEITAPQRIIMIPVISLQCTVHLNIYVLKVVHTIFKVSKGNNNEAGPNAYDILANLFPNVCNANPLHHDLSLTND